MEAAVAGLGIALPRSMLFNAAVERLAALANRRGGGAGGGRLNYTCESTSNACSCTGWLDCVLIMDECRTPPVNSDGTICSGAAPCTCTCTWH
jgi:hypothetical protein